MPFHIQHAVYMDNGGCLRAEGGFAHEALVGDDCLGDGIDDVVAAADVGQVGFVGSKTGHARQIVIMIDFGAHESSRTLRTAVHLFCFTIVFSPPVGAK